MNVIWCVVDCLRYDALSINGYQRPTSTALDERLAEDFISFEDACTQSAFTLSVLSSVLTSTYPSTHGAFRFSDQLPEGIPTLRDMTGPDNKVHAIPGMNFVDSEWGTERAFDSIHDLQHIKSQRRSSQGRANEIRSKTEEVTNGGDNSISLAWFFDLHRPWLSDSEFNGPNTARDHYDTELKFVSEQIEQLCRTLESRGEYNDTMVILTGDHGDLFRDVNRLDGTRLPSGLGEVPGFSKFLKSAYLGHLGKPLFDELLHIPLYVKLPNCEAGGQQFRGQVELIDILPTILDATGDTPAESVEGKSLISTLNNNAGRDYVFAEVEAHACNGRFQVARSPDYKLSYHTSPTQLTPKRPVTYAIRRWFTKNEQFVARTDERHDLTNGHDDLTRLRQAFRTWSERPNATHWNSASQTLSNDQREELESLGYL